MTTPTPTVSLYSDLTTIFTPPATCLENFYAGGKSRLVASLGSDDGHGLIHLECYPPNHNPHRIANPVGWYSPGVCPLGYSSAKIATTNDPYLEEEYSWSSFSQSTIHDETTVWCCPT